MRVTRITSPPLSPTASPACTISPRTCGGSGIARRARCSASSITRLAPHRAQPGADAAPREPRAAGAAVVDPRFLALYDEALRQLAAARSGDNTWWQQRTGIGRTRPIAYFSAEFAHPPVAADLRRRPGRARRRPLQGGLRPRPAVRRCRLHVPAGLLPPERHGRRLAGRELRAHAAGRTPRRARPRRRRHRPASSPCRSATARCWSRCGTSSSVASRCT